MKPAMGRGAGLVWPSIAGRTTRSRKDWPDITYKDVCNEAFKRLHKAAFEVFSLKRRIKTNLDEVSNKEIELRKEKTSDSKRNQLRSEIL